MARPQYSDRLTKIGQEAFALVDECYGSRKVPPHRQLPCVYHGPQTSTVTIMPSVGNSYEVARQFSDGVPTPGHRVPAITSDQAAEFYGGMVIMEYGRRKPFRWA
ncbi:hypothetical protein M5689_005476 [Euphorbia peplus]|nr:hypothetical protein M5689_005476 [Euphorbia peplus]